VSVEFRTFSRGSGGFLRASVACLRVLGLLFIGVVEEVSGSHLQGFSARDGGCIQGFLACLGRASVAGHKGFLWARFFSVFRCFAFVWNWRVGFFGFHGFLEHPLNVCVNFDGCVGSLLGLEFGTGVFSGFFYFWVRREVGGRDRHFAEWWGVRVGWEEGNKDGEGGGGQDAAASLPVGVEEPEALLHPVHGQA